MNGSLKLTLAYDGTGFQGSQRQKSGRSVQEALETALCSLQGSETRVVLAGRTDSGVHAVGQVASTRDIRPDLADERVVQAVNAHLADDLAVIRCERRTDMFHARFDAIWREYRYRVWWGAPQPLLRHQIWQRAAPLDIDAMSKGTEALQGPVDLASFAGNGAGVQNVGKPADERGTVRIVHHCSVRRISSWWGVAPDGGSGVEIRIVADGFLPHSVRTLASALVEIGRGRRPVGWMHELIGRADRRYGPQTAPPHGLVLWRVGYGSDIPGTDPYGEQTMGEEVTGRVFG